MSYGREGRGVSWAVSNRDQLLKLHHYVQLTENDLYRIAYVEDEYLSYILTRIPSDGEVIWTPSAGMRGLPGPRGERGPQGPQGKRGYTGEVGDQGPMGPIGPQGEIGDIGPQGPDGPPGPQGVIGRRGSPGPRGLRGRQGPVGDRGPDGPVGPRGRVGDRGETGEEGEMGEKGLIGPIGPQGPRGPEGPRGHEGEGGVPGPKGQTGVVGRKGPRGKQGPQGPVGPQGDEGPIGPIGDRGERGPDGAMAKEALELLGDSSPRSLSLVSKDVSWGADAPRSLVSSSSDISLRTTQEAGVYQSRDFSAVNVRSVLAERVEDTHIGDSDDIHLSGIRTASLSDLKGHHLISGHGIDIDGLSGRSMSLAYEAEIFHEKRSGLCIDHRSKSLRLNERPAVETVHSAITGIGSVDISDDALLYRPLQHTALGWMPAESEIHAVLQPQSALTDRVSGHQHIYHGRVLVRVKGKVSVGDYIDVKGTASSSPTELLVIEIDDSAASDLVVCYLNRSFKRRGES